ncbi:hypothetical protein ABZX95_06245 [Streptomyces sp. NPDC004232]|uniref:hypothetical protein n=1 Tax=Streptomyces sp. NPDC004232 TaxID=3154454 RepID=UPI0033A03011
MTGATAPWVCARCGKPCRDDAALSMHEYLAHGVWPEGSPRYGEPPETTACCRCGETHGADGLAVEVHRQLKHPKPPPPLPRPDDLSVPFLQPFRFGGHRSRHDTPPPTTPEEPDDD